MTRDERLQHYAQLGVSHNTLFDENATCHMALGFAVLDEVEGGTELTAEERHDFGVNHSLVHRDVMLGGPEVDVDGLRRRREPDTDHPERRLGARSGLNRDDRARAGRSTDRPVRSSSR